ncbi:MAG: BatD family protein [Candidatus Zixiibacteriota bacterium]
MWHPQTIFGVPPSCRIAAHWLIIVFILLSATSKVVAQNQIDTVESLAGIEIQTSVDRAEVYIGDLITYQLTITHDSTIEPVPPPLGANLGAFDVKDYETDVRSKLPDGRIQSTSKFVLSTFTTGDYIIPPIPVMFIMPDSSKKVVLSESVPIKVKSLLAEGSDTADIRPLKAQYEFKRDLTPYYLWGGVILFILALVATLMWLRIRKKKRMELPLDLRPAWEVAFERLVLLKQKDYLADGEYKQYYFELTEIARDYLGRMYQINVLDMTTDEFLFHFKEQQLPNDLYENMGRFLQHADLVKFAKLIPDQKT